MHMANEQYQQNSHKLKTWQLGFQTLERYWASFQVIRLVSQCEQFFQTGRLLEWRVGGAQLQCIYYLMLYTDLKAAEGN